jgi:hypothetical protein
MKMFFVCATIAMVSFWSGFATAALVSVGKEDSDGRQSNDTADSSEGTSEQAKGSRYSD